MDYLILTENEFFRLIHNRQDCSGVDAAYNEFVKCVVELCSGCHDLHHSLFAMTYVVFGGMMLPVSAMLMSCCIETG